MTWTRLSDDFAGRPDLLGVSRSARLLHIEMLLYCNQHLTDGVFPAGALPRITDADAPADDLNELIRAGVWRPHGERAYIVDWDAEKQEPAARVNERRERATKRQQAYRDRGERHAAGDHSTCTSSCPARRDSVTASVTNGVRDRGPSHPSRPKGKGDGWDNRGRDGTPADGRYAPTADPPAARWKAPTPPPQPPAHIPIEDLLP